MSKKLFLKSAQDDLDDGTGPSGARSPSLVPPGLKPGDSFLLTMDAMSIDKKHKDDKKKDKKNSRR